MGEAFNTGPIVDHTPDEFVFNSDIGTTPLIAASMTTFNGSDTANIRLTSLADDGSAATASFVVSEEFTLDDEMLHVQEEVTGIAFADSGLLMGFEFAEDPLMLA